MFLSFFQQPTRVIDDPATRTHNGATDDRREHCQSVVKVSVDECVFGLGGVMTPLEIHRRLIFRPDVQVNSHPTESDNQTFSIGSPEVLDSSSGEKSDQ